MHHHARGKPVRIWISGNKRTSFLKHDVIYSPDTQPPSHLWRLVMKRIWALRGVLTAAFLSTGAVACASNQASTQVSPIDLGPRPYYLLADMDDGPRWKTPDSPILSRPVIFLWPSWGTATIPRAHRRILPRSRPHGCGHSGKRCGVHTGP